MDLEQRFPSNNKPPTQQTEKKERERKKPVVQGRTKQKRPGLVSSLKDAMVPEDIEAVKENIITDIVVPAILGNVRNILIGTIEYWFSSGKGGGSIPYSPYGYSSPWTRSVSSIPARMFNYNAASKIRSVKHGPVPPMSPSEPSDATILSYDNVVLEREDDAKAVLAAMQDQLEQYKVVSVLDMFDLANINVDDRTGNSNNYGWIDLTMASYRRVPGGWLLIFPKPMQID